MAVTPVKRAQRYTCDNPACSFDEIHLLEEEMPSGYYGTVQLVHATGATDEVRWFAHQGECIPAATSAVLEDPHG